MERAALYIRVSTEEQALHGLSIEAQTEALDAWAKANRVKVVDYYVDAGISDRKPASKRPELQRLLQDVETGKISLIVFTKLGRWFRNVAEYFKVQEVLEAHEVSWKTIHTKLLLRPGSSRLISCWPWCRTKRTAPVNASRPCSIPRRSAKNPALGRSPQGTRLEGKKVVKDPEMEGPVSCFFESFLACHSTEKARRAVEKQYGVLFTITFAASC